MITNSNSGKLSMLSKVALAAGAAAVSGTIAVVGAGAACAQPSSIDTQIGNAGNYYNKQAGDLGNFLEKQAGDAGNYYSVNTGRAVSGLINSLLGKHKSP
jgi:hypothetical protein